MWDDRQKGGHCFTMKPDTDGMDANLLGVNDLAIGMDSQGTLLAAVDSGCLVTYNIRRRRLELVSETLGFSARSVCVVKGGKKVCSDFQHFCRFILLILFALQVFKLFLYR